MVIDTESEFAQEWADMRELNGSLYVIRESALTTSPIFNGRDTLIPHEDAALYEAATRRGRIVQERLVDIDAERSDTQKLRSIKRLGEALVAVDVAADADWGPIAKGTRQLDLHLAPLQQDQRYHREVPHSLKLLAAYIRNHRELRGAVVTMTTHEAVGNILQQYGFSVAPVKVCETYRDRIHEAYHSGLRRGHGNWEMGQIVRCYMSAPDLMARLSTKS